MIRIKSGVNLAGMRPELLLAIVVASEYFGIAGFDMVITAVTDGIHSRGSLHYVGLAADLRTTQAGITPDQATGIANNLRAALGAQYDVVVEGDHLHLEYQPK